MPKLIFKIDNPHSKKQLVEFWNKYSNFSKYLGSASVYCIEYTDNYHIVGYSALDEVPPIETKDRFYSTLPVFLNFPDALKDEMIERSSSNSPIPFILQTSCDATHGGFKWSDTPEGHEFWTDVINSRNFDRFYNYFNLKKEQDETKLCKKDSPFRGDSIKDTSGLRCRCNKARVTIVTLSYKKVLGRG